MVDPRLNSVHLEPPRRQLYRHARDLLLHARGNQTVFVEKHQAFNQIANGGGSNTFFIERPDKDAEVGADFCLLDNDNAYPLRVGINTVGRSSENDVVVPDAFVSRRHCAILVHHSTVCWSRTTPPPRTALSSTATRSQAYPTRLHTGRRNPHV